jgi:hypothetical protein
MQSHAYAHPPVHTHLLTLTLTLSHTLALIFTTTYFTILPVLLVSWGEGEDL